MTLCVINGKQCQCQPDDGVACTEGTAAQVQDGIWKRLRKSNEEIERLRDELAAANTRIDNLIRHSREREAYLRSYIG